MSHEGFVKYPFIGKLGTWYHQGSSVWTQVGNGYNMYSPQQGAGADFFSGRTDSPPATPYTAIMHITWNPTDTTGYILGGIGFTDGTAIVYLNTRFYANNYTSAWDVLYASNSTTGNANLVGYNDGSGYPWALNGWMAIRNDGTNIYFFIGDESGQNFYQVYSEAKGSHLGTITGIGFFNDSRYGITNTMVDSWQVIGV